MTSSASTTVPVYTGAATAQTVDKTFALGLGAILGAAALL